MVKVSAFFFSIVYLLKQNEEKRDFFSVQEAVRKREKVFARHKSQY